MLVSAVVAGAAGVGVVAKTQWRRITGGLKGDKKDAQGLETSSTTEQQQ
jgi:hypothetical protein